MPALSIFCGALLIAIGVAGYFYGRSAGAASPTALIPAAFGVIFLVCGLIAGARDTLRKHVMHVAAAVALIGFVLPAARLMMRLSQLTMTPSVISQIAMAVICLFFLIAAIGSFASARRSDRI